MMRTKFFSVKLLFTLFTILLALFLNNLYILCGGNLIGVMFGSVNKSIWESCKPFMLSFFIMSMLELIAFQPRLRRFAVSRVISLTAISAVYIAVRLILVLAGCSDFDIVLYVICIISAFFISEVLYSSQLKLEAIYIHSLFMLLLTASLFFSFTPFPPKSYIFLDTESGIYGIIPKYVDMGAAVLDTMYYM